MELEITFPGNKKVDAHYKQFTIQTDQPISSNGDETAPEPFTHFIASIGTCTGIYILTFCQRNEIPTKDMKLKLLTNRNNQTHMIDTIDIQITLPPDFPQKYKKAVIKSAEACTVKKHLEQPPKITISIQD